ncbi:MAG: hypothetical protein V3R83_09705 [Gammaproteobacteria bacterium]
MDTEQFTEEMTGILKGELAAIREGILEEIQEGLSGEESERFKSLDDGLEAVRKELAAKFKEKPLEPGAPDVKDLEKRLEAAETKQVETEEKLRLLKAAPTLPQKKDGDLDWKGSIMTLGQSELEYLSTYYLPASLSGPSSAERKALDSALFATGGKLPAEVADRFIDFIIEEQVALSRVVTRRMNSPQGHTDELRVATRSIRKAIEATAPALADAVTTKRRTLDTVEIIWTEDITLTLLEDNIERAGMEGHIAQIIATQFGNDSNDLAWNGDEADSNAFVSINDGWLLLLQNSKDSDVTDVDHTSAVTNTQVLSDTLQGMPSKFLGRTDHVFWVGVTFGQKYAEEVSTRETALGDQVLVEGFPALRYFGIPVVPDTHIASVSRRVILTPTTNLFWGIQRVFRVDSEFIPRRRLVEYTLTSRTDVEYATGEAVVNGFNVPVSLN